MLKREVLRSIPNQSKYFAVKLKSESVDLRIPSALVFTNLSKSINTENLVSMFSLLSGDADTATIFSAFRNAGSDILSIVGFIVGKAWYHQGLDLEADPNATDLEFGAKVFEELDNAGYDLNDIVMIALTVMHQFKEANTISKEALEKANFFGQKKAKRGSSK